MSDRTLRDEARLYFVPYILGNSRAAHRLAAKIHRKFGIISVICDDRRSVLDLLDLTSRTVVLSATDSSRLLAEQLISLAQQNCCTLPLLIPTDGKYASTIQAEREMLERTFVFADADRLFESSPLMKIAK